MTPPALADNGVDAISARCAEPGCVYPAGTSCAMAGCPGRNRSRFFKIDAMPLHERPDIWAWGMGIRLAESARAELRGSTIGPASDVCVSFHAQGVAHD